MQGRQIAALKFAQPLVVGLGFQGFHFGDLVGRHIGGFRPTGRTGGQSARARADGCPLRQARQAAHDWHRACSHHADIHRIDRVPRTSVAIDVSARLPHGVGQIDDVRNRTVVHPLRNPAFRRVVIACKRVAAFARTCAAQLALINRWRRDGLGRIAGRLRRAIHAKPVRVGHELGQNPTILRQAALTGGARLCDQIGKPCFEVRACHGLMSS